MLKTLCHLECKKILGWNVFRNSQNQKNLHIHSGLNMAAYLILILFLCAYNALMVCALHLAGAGSVVPTILILTGTAIIFLISILDMGQNLFSQQGLSILHALPLPVETIALSRLLSQYIRSILLVLVILLPGTILYGVISSQKLIYYPVIFLGLLGLPLLPLALSVFLSTLIMVAASKTRNPSKTKTFLSVFFILLMLAAPIRENPLNYMNESPEELLVHLMDRFMEIRIYPPAQWVADSALTGRPQGLLLFLGISGLLFCTAAIFLCKKFDRITTEFSKARVHNKQGVKSQRQSSPLKALYKKEAKQYFSSSIYVSNTIIGPILTCIASVALLFVNLQMIEEILPLSLHTFLCIVLVLPCCLMSPCSVAITMEGKQIWQIKTLPVQTKTLLDSKLLWNLTLLIPAYLLGQISMTLVCRPSLIDLIWQL